MKLIGLQVMSSRPGRILALLLTAAAAALIWAALASQNDLAGVAVLFIALYYLIALVVLLAADFVITALVRSDERFGVPTAAKPNPHRRVARGTFTDAGASDPRFLGHHSANPWIQGVLNRF